MITAEEAYAKVKGTEAKGMYIDGIGETQEYFMFFIMPEGGGPDIQVFDIPAVNKKTGEIFKIDFFDWCDEVEKGNTRTIDIKDLGEQA